MSEEFRTPTLMEEFHWQIAQKIPVAIRKGKEEDELFYPLFRLSHYEPRSDIYGNLWLVIWFDSLNSHYALEFYKLYQKEIVKAVHESGYWCGFQYEWGSHINRHFLFQVPLSTAILGINSPKSMP
jgi:hypothetical protein